MKFYLFAVIFILLSLNVSSYWQTYQNDLRNTGIANGTGYFPIQTSNFSDNSLGMDFQPLVGDLEANGKNEIAVFSNNSLIIFNPQLSILGQAKVGSILGQPALFNFDNDGFIEVVFNSRQNSTDYFFAYQFNNSNLQQEFNITLANEANFSGIKCFSSSGNFCVFKDKLNYINVVNMASKTNDAYNTSIYEERRHTVPAIGDIDNDGNPEAVFWFNADNNSGYGFLVFDLGSRILETNFNHSGIVDNIFSPLILGPSLFHHLFTLKGQPVLVDLNNDNKLEIAASVFYDESRNDDGTDRFTELFVYSYNGTRLFSKCERNVINNICDDGLAGPGGKGMWEGTNPFVLDYDKNGIDDICFVKDVKNKVGFIVFSHMALSCYNHSGGKLAEVKLENAGDTMRGTTVIADMNNDGEKEIIVDNKIYMINGTMLFSLNLPATASPIAVDIDGNKGLDLIWTFGNQTKVFLDSNNYSVDLSVNSADISFTKIGENQVNVSVVIKNFGQVDANNVKIAVYNAETLENKTSALSIKGNGNAVFSALVSLKEGEKIAVSADFENEIEESDENNNFAIREFAGLPYVFVRTDLFEPSNTASEFKNYIKNKLTSGYYTDNENSADIKVYIGKNNPRNQDNNIKTLEDFEFGYDYGNIVYNDKIGALPYNGLVGAFKDSNGKIIVMVVGNEIEGDIIGVKEFIKNRATLLITKDKESIFIDDENADAVKVYDYLHLGGNMEHYGINNDEFKKIVKNSLNDEMFTVEDKSVAANNGVSLRLRNLKPGASNAYLEYLSSNGVPVEIPVVLAHGLFSNLTTWEVLGAEISNTGRDTWLIEITGGPSQDCDDCIDYTFYNLTDIFVPALLNGVLDFTGKDKIQYVGFSNGCRAALDSLERSKFDSNKVETFVAVGCPGAFEGFDIGASGIKLIDDKINRNIENRKHIGITEMLVIGLLGLNSVSLNEEKISTNLWRQYNTWINSSNDQQPGNINLINFIIIHGNAGVTSDGIVSLTDEKSIYNNVNISTSKSRFNIFATHIDLDNRPATKSLIKKSVNKEKLNFLERNIYLKETNSTNG
ncbi:hypothetical protein HYX04_05670 [Candidatus Woesearchaeota archaeon]|nr:hypothetical protein [Candidatus Woesearchaeota archaeon]